MTPETTKQLKDTMREMYNAGVDDALNLVAAVMKSNLKRGLSHIRVDSVLNIIETSRENLKGK